MKTIALMVLMVPGAWCAGDFFPEDNPYTRLLKAFAHARCVVTKTVSLELVGDTLVVDAFRAYYSPRFRYPYCLLYEAEDSVELRERGFTDGREIRIAVPEPGRYYLLVNDVNRSWLRFEVTERNTFTGELRVGCVVE